MDSSSKVNFEISLQQLIEKLHILFSEDHVNTDEVQQVMQTYQSKYSDWKKYANFDPHRYVLSGQKQLFTCRFYFKKHFCLALRFPMYDRSQNFRALSWGPYSLLQIVLP